MPDLRTGLRTRLRTPTKLKVAYAGLAATDIFLAGRAEPAAHRVRFLTKPLLIPTLAASLVTDERATGSPLRSSTLVAQLGGWGGDVALLGKGTKPFLAGAGSFAVGHVAYLTGFVGQRSATPLIGSTAARVVVASWALTAPVMAVMAHRQHQELGVPVFGYATVLAAMVVGAGHLDPRLSPAARWLTSAGAGMFMLSDTLLGARKFALVDPPAWLESAVMATYAAAQFLLSEGAARC